MKTNELVKEIEQLDVSERLTLVEDVWDSIAHSNSVLPMPEWQKKELDKRYAEYERGDAELHDWKNVHNALRERHK